MKVKRIIAGLLAMVMLLTATLPTSNVKAASGTASLDSLGKLEQSTWAQKVKVAYGYRHL